MSPQRYTTIDDYITAVVLPPLGDQADEYDVNAIAKATSDYRIDTRTSPDGEIVEDTSTAGVEQVLYGRDFWNVIEDNRIVHVTIAKRSSENCSMSTADNSALLFSPEIAYDLVDQVAEITDTHNSRDPIGSAVYRQDGQKLVFDFDTETEPDYRNDDNVTYPDTVRIYGWSYAIYADRQSSEPITLDGATFDGETTARQAAEQVVTTIMRWATEETHT